MGGFIAAIGGAVISLLLAVLPTSPFLGMTLGGEYETALGWLNWILPVDGMLGLLMAWILAGIFWAVIQWVIDKVEGLAGE